MASSDDGAYGQERRWVLVGRVSYVAYWWQGDRAERYWIEIRWVEGIGRSLACPAPPRDGTPHNPWYQLVGKVDVGDVIFHWSAVEHRFVGRSRAASGVHLEDDEWIVELEGFTPLRAPVDLSAVRRMAPKLTDLRDRLTVRYGPPLYLPFQYRDDGLRLMSNYFAKLPAEAVDLLFDGTGLGEVAAEPPPPEDGAAVESDKGGAARTGFLAPFRPKADTDYLANLPGGTQRRGRTHETLVNNFALWLEGLGFAVGRNAAIDLGLIHPPLVIEAKIVVSWPNAIPGLPAWGERDRCFIGEILDWRSK